MKKDQFIITCEQLINPLHEHMAAGTIKNCLPITNKERHEYACLEAIGRTLCGIAPFVETSELKNVRINIEALHLGIKSITNPNSPDFLNFNQGTQPLVDTAFFALAFLRSPKVLWGGLPEST